MRLDYSRILTDRLDGQHGLPKARLEELARRFPEIRGEVESRRRSGEYGFYSLGRQDQAAPGEPLFAVALVEVDAPVSDKVLDELKTHQAVRLATVVEPGA